MRIDHIQPRDIQPGDSLVDRRLAHLVLDIQRRHGFSQEDLAALARCVGNLAHVLAEEVVEF